MEFDGDEDVNLVSSCNAAFCLYVRCWES